MKFSTAPVRGTVDYSPSEMEIRSYAEKIIIDTYKENGFLQIKTPILENLDLLLSGDSGDNQKLMFKTIKRGEKLDLTRPGLTEKDIAEEGLRYDLTVPLVRFFAGNREKLPYPFKAIQVDEAFRAERPQKGRIREFTQCDIDILGEPGNIGEIELLCAAAKAYERLGFSHITFKINDRRILGSIITGAGFEAEKIPEICISLDKFDKIGLDGVASELISSGFESENVEKLAAVFSEIKASGTVDESFEVLLRRGAPEDAVESLKTIIGTVKKFISPDFKVEYDISIIRGQGYYTGTIFEVYDDEFGRAIGGGGRYDKMVEKFISAPVPAVGMSIGFYSVVMLMTQRNVKVNNRKLALLYEKTSSYDEIFGVKTELQGKGYEVSAFVFPKNFKNFAERIKNNGYTMLVKIGEPDKIITDF